MSLRSRALLIGGVAALALAIPALSQDAPESILPPGFGDPVEEPRPSTAPRPPSDLLPDAGLRTPGAPQDATDGRASEPGDEDEDGEDEELALAPVLQDLPPQARRSLDNVGILVADSGDMGAAAFGSSDGRYLSYIMRKMQTPIASRWASILLRRALLSQVDTPRNVSGQDWVAERAWLLLRMGEAESARLLVQAVDADRYTPKLQDVALQAALATADPSGACAFTEWVSPTRREQAWPMVRAMCLALAGESAEASLQIGRARSRGAGTGIDGILAEKVVGAGINSRRSVQVQWDGVDQLTAWRFGLASATAVDIPEPLMAAASPQVRAWFARAPMIAPEKRLEAAEHAASLGVLSSAALVDFYGLVGDTTDAADSSGKSFLTLRTAYSGDGGDAKLSAMRTLWEGAGEDASQRYARLILTARAAAMLRPNEDQANSADRLIASMLSAGLDIQAARWAPLLGEASGDIESRGWALLAVGAPRGAVPWARGTAESYISDAGDEPRGRFLFAGLAGLGRLSDADISDMAGELGIPVGRSTPWTRALDRAVAAREPGTVALLCALGLQENDIRRVSPVMLYHAIVALRKVGLGNEARMIAAEAVTRG